MTIGDLRSLVRGTVRRENLMSTETVRLVNLGAVACEPRPQLLTASGGTAPESGRRWAQPARDSASMSCLPVRLSARTTSKNLTRSGC